MVQEALPNNHNIIVNDSKRTKPLGKKTMETTGIVNSQTRAITPKKVPFRLTSLATLAMTVNSEMTAGARNQEVIPQETVVPPLNKEP